ncbi:odorant receptor 13a-like isoform X2 [Diachasmimorpha longicaudata]|uniref:odorant receptor 13a-like isoform X2 n=1 Tax=Diachasmimorpha longicaudata TaxID=58733 RepID=UPI0030B8D37D
MSVCKRSTCNMDFWDQRYYSTTKTLSCLMGLWPYQSKTQLIVHRSIIFLLFIIQVIPEILAVFLNSADLDVIMDSVGTFIMDAGFLINAFTYFWNFKKMKILLDNVKENWKIFPKNEGQQILEKYARDGGKLATLYAAGICASGIFFTTEPLQWRLLNTMLNANFSVPLFCTPMEYPMIDVEKYYYVILFIQEISVAVVISMVVVYDLLFFLFSQHVCGLFAGLGYAIENLPVDRHSRSDDRGFRYVKRCIQIHSRAIRFSNSLEDLVVWNFFFMMGLNMIIMSLTAVQVELLDDLVHLFITCFMCQRIIDHSSDLQAKITNSRWCFSTVKTQQLIKLMILRSQIPNQLTAGKLMVMSLETFTVIVKTSASYFTVFLAMQ